MPKGVEHKGLELKTLRILRVRTSVMPKGVEHFEATFAIAAKAR